VLPWVMAKSRNGHRDVLSCRTGVKQTIELGTPAFLLDSGSYAVRRYLLGAHIVMPPSSARTMRLPWGTLMRNQNAS
jgi:hypothetical protein